MGYKVYAIKTDGRKLYLRQDTHTWGDEKTGYEWASEAAADNVVRGLKKNSKLHKKGYRVFQYEETVGDIIPLPPDQRKQTLEIVGRYDLSKSKPMMTVKRPVKVNPVPKVTEAPVEHPKAIDPIFSALSDIMKRREECEAEVQKEQAALQDILHYIELNNFSASDGYKFAKMIKESRIRRRKAKDDIVYIDALLEKINVNELNKIKEMHDREYRPRVLKEMFD